MPLAPTFAPRLPDDENGCAAFDGMAHGDFGPVLGPLSDLTSPRGEPASTTIFEAARDELAAWAPRESTLAVIDRALDRPSFALRAWADFEPTFHGHWWPLWLQSHATSLSHAFATAARGDEACALRWVTRQLHADSDVLARSRSMREMLLALRTGRRTLRAAIVLVLATRDEPDARASLRTAASRFHSESTSLSIVDRLRADWATADEAYAALEGDHASIRERVARYYDDTIAHVEQPELHSMPAWSVPMGSDRHDAPSGPRTREQGRAPQGESVDFVISFLEETRSDAARAVRELDASNVPSR